MEIIIEWKYNSLYLVAICYQKHADAFPLLFHASRSDETHWVFIFILHFNDFTLDECGIFILQKKNLWE